MKESESLKFASGVYVKLPSELSVRVPLTVVVSIIDVRRSSSTSESCSRKTGAVMSTLEKSENI